MFFFIYSSREALLLKFTFSTILQLKNHSVQFVYNNHVIISGLKSIPSLSMLGCSFVRLLLARIASFSSYGKLVKLLTLLQLNVGLTLALLFLRWLALLKLLWILKLFKGGYLNTGYCLFSFSNNVACRKPITIKIHVLLYFLLHILSYIITI